jgi:RNA polymerase sigma factor (sigma-70 family)
MGIKMTTATAVHIIVPLIMFAAIVILGLWTRFYVRKLFVRHQQSAKWVHASLVVKSLFNPLIIWFMILGSYVAILISILSPTIKKLSGEVLASLFAISFTWVTIGLIEKFIRYYTDKFKVTQSLTSAVIRVIKIIIIGIVVLVVFNIWGVQTLSFVIIIATILLIAALIFRNTIDNFLAGIEIVYGNQIKVGHFIKLESGESGYISQIDWTRTIIRTIEGNWVIIPNFKLKMNIIVNYVITPPQNISDDVRIVPAINELKKLIDLLSDREREVLCLLGKGATNREIAQELMISEHTVKSHIRTILNKLNINNRQQAAVYAEREGLLQQATISKNNF